MRAYLNLPLLTDATSNRRPVEKPEPIARTKGRNARR
jgi:hypothetical protein